MAFDFNPNDILHPGKKGDGKDLKPSQYVPSLIAVIFIFVFLFLLTGAFYTVEPNEVGVVLTFGKFSRTTEPGLHFKWPLGIEKAIPVKVKKIYTEEFGFRTKTPGRRTVYSTRSYSDESLMLTGDLNVLDIEWIVQYKVKDPYAALFKIRDARGTLRDITESVMRRVIGDNTFNAILTERRVEINVAVQTELQETLDLYNAGLHIVTVKLQDVNPPDPVKPAFNEVNEAKQEREKLINQAWEVYNQQIPQARGLALKMVKEAEGYALEKINIAKGDANRFLLLYGAYAKARDITRTRLYLESMNKVLNKAGKKYIVDSDQKSILPLMRFGE